MLRKSPFVFQKSARKKTAPLTALRRFDSYGAINAEPAVLSEVVAIETYETRSERFLRGANFAIFKVWPLAFAGLLAHDVICYFAYPEDRYGNQYWKILVGLSPNQLNLANHLGSEVVGGRYWLGIPIIIGAPCVMGAIYALTKQATPIVRDLNHFEVLHGLHCGHDLLSAIFPWSDLRRTLIRAEHLQDVAGLSLFVKQHSLVARYYGLRALMRIAKNTAASNDFEIQALHENAAETLREVSSYYAWRAGVHESRLANFWYIPKAAYLGLISYPLLYLLGVIGLKTKGTIDYFLQKHACEKQNNVYLYLLASEAYECTPCGNWPFVSYNKMFADQDCLDSLLSQKNISPQQIVNYLAQWKKVRNISRLDLSKQLWREWAFESLATILTTAENVLPKQTITVDLSASTQNWFPPTLAMTERLATFLQIIQPKQIIANAQAFDAQATCILLATNQQGVVNTLDFSNPIGNAGANCIANFTMTNPIETLLLPNANITAEGIQALVQAHNNVAHLDISGNGLNTAAWDVLIKKPSLRTLNLSEIPMLPVDLQQFCQNVSSSVLQSLTLNHIPGFDNNYAAALMPCMPTLQTLNMRHNRGLSSVGAYALLNSAQNGTLFKIDLAYCGIEAFSEVLDVLPATVRELDISANTASVVEYQQALQVLGNKNIKVLTLTKLLYGDALGTAFSTAFVNRTLPIEVNFSDTQMTTQGAAAVLSVKALGAVDLSHNQLAGIGAALSSAAIENSFFTALNLRNSHLSSTDLQALIEVLPGAKFTSVVLDQNSIYGQGLALAQQLIEPVPHMKQLGTAKLDSNINRDEIRSFRRATAHTPIQQLSVRAAELDTQAALAFCRLSSLTHVDLVDNAGYQAVDFHNCQMRNHPAHLTNFFARSATTNPAIAVGFTLLPGVVFALGMVGILIFLSYLMQASCRAYRRFNAAIEPVEKPTLETANNLIP